MGKKGLCSALLALILPAAAAAQSFDIVPVPAPPLSKKSYYMAASRDAGRILVGGRGGPQMLIPGQGSQALAGVPSHAWGWAVNMKGDAVFVDARRSCRLLLWQDGSVKEIFKDEPQRGSRCSIQNVKLNESGQIAFEAYRYMTPQKEGGASGEAVYHRLYAYDGSRLSLAADLAVNDRNLLTVTLGDDNRLLISMIYPADDQGNSYFRHVIYTAAEGFQEVAAPAEYRDWFVAGLDERGRIIWQSGTALRITDWTFSVLAEYSGLMVGAPTRLDGNGAPFTDQDFANGRTMMSLLCAFPRRDRPVWASILGNPEGGDLLAVVGYPRFGGSRQCKYGSRCPDRTSTHLVRLVNINGRELPNYCKGGRA